MRAHDEAGVEAAAQRDPDGAPRRLERAEAVLQRDLDVFAAFLESHRGGGFLRALDLAGLAAGRRAILQRGEAVAVYDDVRVHRVGRERLAEHHAGLAVALRAAALQLDARREREIAAHRLPCEAERVVRAPHVLAAGANQVFTRGRIE